jgi:putative redox protein
VGEATATWTSGKQFVIHSGTGHAIVVDAQPEVGGADSGMSPMELILGGLAGCTGIDVVYLLTDKMRQRLSGVTVEVAGKRADQIPKVYTEIDVVYRLRGSDLDTKTVVRALKMSEQKLCSVSEMLRHTATIRGRYVIEDVHGGETIEGVLD